MNKRLIAPILVLLMCLSVIHFPNELSSQVASLSDSEGSGMGANEDYSVGIYNLSPVNGTPEGGTEVTISGSNFDSLFSQGLDEKTWYVTSIENNLSYGSPVSLTIDKPEDKLYAIYNGGLGDLNLVSNSDGTWNHLKTFSGGSGPTLAMNQDTNHVMIAYHGMGGQDLIGAHWDPSSQGGGQGIIDGDFGVNVGEMASNAICTLSMTNCGATSATDYRQISYYDQTNGDLKRAWYNGNWNTQTIDSTDDVGHYTSIALDSNGSIHISYCDITNSVIKYATSDSGNEGTWQISTIFPLENGYGCTESSIGVDSRNNVFIATSSKGSVYSEIKLATNKGGSWNIDTINSKQSFSPSLALDSNDKVYISYFEYSESNNNWDLVVSRSVGLGWESEKVATGLENYGWVDTALDSNEDLHLLFSYGDGNTGKVEHAYQISSLVGHWKMEETSGSLSNSAKSSHDAGDVGSLSYSESGIVGNSINFTENNHAVVSHHEDLKMENRLTVMGWINPNNPITAHQPEIGSPSDSLQCIIGKWPNSYILCAEVEVIGFRLANSSYSGNPEHGKNFAIVTSNEPIPHNTWTHLAGTYDGQVAILYVNGEEVSREYTSELIGDDQDNLYIGADSYPQEYNFADARIDEVMLFNDALDARTIKNYVDYSNFLQDSNNAPTLQARFSTQNWSETVNLTYVDNNTLTLSTPPGPEEQTVNLTLIGANGRELELRDAYTFDTTAVDSDGDGYLDDTDDCPSLAGNSTNDRIGCIDSDGDGYSDADETWSLEMGADAFKQDSSQWSDIDGDGFGDNAGGNEWDLCHDVPGNSTLDRFGCPDTDGDGYSDPDSFWTTSLWDSIGYGPDEFYLDPTQWRDMDGDGYGDNSNENATTPDDCPDIWGNSTFDRYGCLDSDGDGMSDEIDDFPQDAQRTSDVDDDGLDDLYDDNCPNTYNPLQGDLDGDGLGDLCDTDEDGDGIHDGIDNCPQGTTGWTSGTLLDYDGDGCLDGTEDTDDDGDGILDGMDGCPKGDFGWQSSNITDHDSDGCNDNTEDLDDDGDGKDDSKDSCPKGANDWTSTTIADRDDDGCRDYDEDLDDDGDGVTDENDTCPNGVTQWLSNPSTDSNSDGCHDDLDESPNQTNEEKSESFVDLLASGNLDAIGIVLAILLPIVGISVSLMLRKRKASFVQTLGDRIDDCESATDLESINNELMDLVAKDNINQAQYDVLKFRIEGKRSAIHSETYHGSIETSITESNAPDLMAIGYDGNDGYEWLDYNGTKWYRAKGTSNEWIQWGQLNQ